MPLSAAIAGMIEAQRGTAALWAPVALGTGTGVYFALAWEPSAPLAGGMAAAGAVLIAAAMRLRLGGAPVLLALMLIGFALARAETARMAAPVLAEEHFGPVIGRVVHVDRNSQNRLRLTLDRVHLPGRPAERTPARVRVVLGIAPEAGVARPGARVMLRARLTPPPGPVEPAGFDFRRHAWFAGVGAIGYGAEPAVLATPTPQGGLPVATLRHELAEAIRARMPPRPGGFAAAILTGDRVGVDPRDLGDLRASNLAHLLAISGLHMGLLTGAVFASLRLSLALIPAVALRLPLKKIAAAGALAAGAGYLVLSGASVATQRAFVMAAVVLCAVLVDRPALTLRAVALAATILLVWRPSALLGPGFQMSFAATVALIAAYDALRRRRTAGRRRHWRVVQVVGALLFTSAVAGLATAPYSAFHFNMASRYGLLANVLAVPAMGLLVMPAGLAAVLLWPLGLEGLPLSLMRVGIDHILTVAHWVGAMPGAVRPVPSAPLWVLPVLTLGALAIVLMRGAGRLAGVPLLVAALAGWALAERPAVLIAPGGGIAGVMGPEGRMLTRARGEGFAARVWLENDGDPAGQGAAAARPAPPLLRVSGPEDAAAACREARVVLAPEATVRPPGPCRFVGRAALARAGALAFHGPELRPVTAAARSGARPWTRAGAGG